MKNTIIKGLAGFAIGTTILKTIKEVRDRKLQKEMYEQAEVVADEQSDKE